MKNSTKIFLLIILGSGTLLSAQEDCFVKTDQLGPPLRSDTVRQIDTEPPYRESLYITIIYDGKIVYDTTRVIDPETFEEKIHTYKYYSARHIKPDHITVCGSKTLFFKQKGNCFQLYQIKEKHELNKVNRQKNQKQ